MSMRTLIRPTLQSVHILNRLALRSLPQITAVRHLRINAVPSASFSSTPKRLSSSQAEKGASEGSVSLPALGSEITAGDGDFDRILKAAGETPVVVDFFANWCGPCRVLAPVLQKVVKENGKTFLVKVNVDEAEQTAAANQIMSLPTVVIFRNGAVQDSFIGSRDESAVRKFIEKATSQA
ncbi:hypothetical protein HDU85_002290 [Gaertneriomyces sp. JEL0708]|nr:hypothetical protein HDU85_002290 [Gaertneriomyces sp. JEL0708]